MKKIGILALLAFCAAISLYAADDPELTSEKWELTFSDDFDGDRLDYDKWIPKDPWEVERNDELQGYVVKSFFPENGILKIRCDDRACFYDGKKRDYSSGMMTTLKSFTQTYGRFEIRCKVPKGKGFWPAFWLLPEDLTWPPEIDILEILSEKPDKIYLTHHWANPKNPKEYGDSITKELIDVDFSEEFHTFTVIWAKDSLKWFIDGKLKHQATKEVPDKAMFMLVNLAVGGWAVKPDKNTKFPSDFEVDYIKAWKKRGESNSDQGVKN